MMAIMDGLWSLLRVVVDDDSAVRPLIRPLPIGKYPHVQEAIGLGVTPHGCAALRGAGPGPISSTCPTGSARIARAAARTVIDNGRSPGWNVAGQD